VESLTLVSQTHVPDSVYEETRKHFTDKEIVDLTYITTTINAWNRLAIGLRAVPGRYRPSTK
jgi:alkylhydroperoxidase family enzyme